MFSLVLSLTMHFTARHEFLSIRKKDFFFQPALEKTFQNELKNINETELCCY